MVLGYNVCHEKGRHYWLSTHIDDPVLWAVRVGSAHVQTAPISHWLNYSNVVSAVEMLQHKFASQLRRHSTTQVYTILTQTNSTMVIIT